MEYINKKWDLPTMEKKIELLKKIISPAIVDLTLKFKLNITDSRLDALYLTYYDLKDRYCKIKRRTFGEPKRVDYKRKERQYEAIWYNTPITGTYSNATSATYYTSTCLDYTSLYSNVITPSDYTWTITTATGR